MDSMRSLDTSLPSASAQSTHTEPPEELLSAFKTAALSVTSLYRTSVAGQAHARHEGYQEALEDIRAFLNREGLALDSVDGAKIRYWLDERIDGTASANASGSGDGVESGSQRNSHNDRTTSSSAGSTHPLSTQQQQQQQPAATTSINTHEVSPPAFTFSAGPSFPTYIPPKEPSMDDLTMQLDGGDHHTSRSDLTPATVFNPENIPASFTSSSLSQPPQTISGMPTTSSTTTTTHLPSASTSHPASRQSRNGACQGNDGATGFGMNLNIGSKRKHGFGDFFDISNFGGMNGKDGFGPNGGKRGRFL